MRDGGVERGTAAGPGRTGRMVRGWPHRPASKVHPSPEGPVRDGGAGWGGGGRHCGPQENGQDSEGLAAQARV